METDRYGLSICDRRFHLTEYVEDTDRMCCVHMLDSRIEQMSGVVDIESIVLCFRVLLTLGMTERYELERVIY